MLIRTVIVTGGLSAVGGCQTASVDSSLDASADSSATSHTLPLAYAAGKRIDWADMRPLLTEAAGQRVLAELVMTHMLNDRVAQRGLTVTPDQIDAERGYILASLSDDPDEAQRIMTTVRRDGGWGAKRFDARLRRRAAARMLVQDQVSIKDEALRREYERLYGPKYQARLILVDSSSEAVRLIDLARNGAFFPDLAIEHSTDSSSAQGGLLPLISPDDVTFPKEVRQTLVDMTPGQIAGPIALDMGFAVLKLVEKIARQTIDFDEAKPQLAKTLRQQTEELLMQKLVRQLIVDADVQVVDPALGRAWKQQLRQMQEQR